MPTPYSRLTKRSSAPLIALLLLIAAPLIAGDHKLEFYHANDLFAGSREDDDLYTATVGVAFETPQWTLRLRENLFTDRAAMLRFDETYLTWFNRKGDGNSRWFHEGEWGLVRRGRGLFGESTQNFIHEIVNEPEVRLPYVGGTTLHPYLRMKGGRGMPLAQRWRALASIEAETAGFKEHARIELKGRREFPTGGWLELATGLRYSNTEYAPLVPWMNGRAPTYELAGGYREWISLSWTQNAFGTEDRHFHLRFKIPL